MWETWHLTEEKYIQKLIGNTEGKTQHGRPKRRWKDNIKTDLKEI
jgi:hypothetical protein